MIRKNEELAQAYKEKNRRLLQTQELHDKLKRKAMLGQMQDAASEAVDSTIQAAATAGPGIGDSTNGWHDGQQGGMSYGNGRYLNNLEQLPVSNNKSHANFGDLRGGSWGGPPAGQSEFSRELAPPEGL